MAQLDSKEFRNALGSFATGVTIVTTLEVDEQSAESKPVAMTANSFSSVSLEPPLVLWSIARTAQCFDAFEKSDYFAVHVLHDAQQGLSNLCATKDADKFAGISWHEGIEGIPVFDDYNTCFQCQVEHRYEGGDHVIIVGRVHAFDNRQRETHARPLLFYQGQYKGVS